MSLHAEGTPSITSHLSNGNESDIKSVLDTQLETVGVNAPLNSNDDTVLLYTARNGNPKMLEFLLAKGADINVANMHGETPLIAAIKAKKEENAIFLISRGANINCKDEKGCSALIAACQNGLEDTVQELIAKGVNVNYRDPSGWTALMWGIFSLKRKSYTITKRLLDSNSDVGFRYDCIGTVYDYAKSLHCEEVAELISQYEDMPEETISDWEYLKDQIINKWTLKRDIANILDRCNSLRALSYVAEQKKMDLAGFLSQTPEEINELPTLTHRKQHLNKFLRKFHLQNWTVNCLGIDFVKKVSKYEASALAQIIFLASVARQLMVISGSIGYVSKNMCMLDKDKDRKQISLALAETKTVVLLVKNGLTELLKTVKEDKIRPADWIPNKPQKKRRMKHAVFTGVIFTMSVLFVCWEGQKLLSKCIVS